MAVYNITRKQLKEKSTIRGGRKVEGILNTFEIPVAGGFTNTYSALFTGATNEKIDTGDSFKPSRSSSFSISAWVKYTGGEYDSNTMLVSKLAAGRGAVFRGYRVQFNSEIGVAFSLQAVGNNFITQQTAKHSGSNALVPTKNQWNHIVATYNGNFSGSGMNIYINGVSCVSQSAGGDIVNNFQRGSTPNVLDLSQGEIQDTSTISIGSRSGGAGSVWIGNIDEFVFFNGELAQSDVTALYNSGLPNLATDIDYSKQFITPAHYYRMGDNDGGTGTTVTDQVGSANGTLFFMNFEEDVPD
tara:strand:- start:536 stop:1435 length:900 start_codon:yes stop_codon:yes gene_type:complete